MWEETVSSTELNIQPEEGVLVSSTGVIGMFANMGDNEKKGQGDAPEVSEFGGAAASKAIAVTTDTVPKEVSFTFEVAENSYHRRNGQRIR